MTNITNRPILLVEDNPSDIELTKRAFRQNHLLNELIVAENGQAALEYLLSETGRNLPAVVLLDLNLPLVSGFEVLQRIRADPRTRLLPVVVLTTSNEERDLIESYSRGANSYIRKPVSFTEFTTAVAQLGVYWLALNEVPPSGE